jgi:hypothetical protein
MSFSMRVVYNHITRSLWHVKKRTEAVSTSVPNRDTGVPFCENNSPPNQESIFILSRKYCTKSTHEMNRKKSQQYLTKPFVFTFRNSHRTTYQPIAFMEQR